jgi:hypothetical protein
MCKDSIKLENYHLNLDKLEHFLEFRTRNHRFPVKTSRWVGQEIHRRKCHYTNLRRSIAYHNIKEKIVY